MNFRASTVGGRGGWHGGGGCDGGKGGMTVVQQINRLLLCAELQPP